MTLGEKQELFTELVANFIAWAVAQGYKLRFGEVQRTQAQADANAASGAGISKSLHLVCLAVDFKLFINGIYQTDSEVYRPLGEYWKSLNPLCCWGGDFSKPDGNHFSITHEGRK